jgi:GNAT superfamily N-acetyltransferase
VSGEETGQTEGYAIRPCRPEDIPQVVALSDRWAAEDSTIGQVAIPTEMARSWLGGTFWVAEHDSRVIGFAYASTHSDELAVVPAGERYLKLEELYVLPDHRNRGVGGRLVEQVLAEAAAQGITHGWLYSSARERQRVVSFYQRHGFKMWFVGLHR